jgi:hypothetical protein
VKVGRHDNSKSCTRFNIDMGIDAPLADEPQARETFQQGRRNRRPFADEDQRLSLSQSIGENVDISNVVIPDSHVVAVEPAKASERAKRVEIVVQNRDLHAGPGLSTMLQHRARSKYSSGRRGALRPSGIIGVLMRFARSRRRRDDEVDEYSLRDH